MRKLKLFLLLGINNIPGLLLYSILLPLWIYIPSMLDWIIPIIGVLFNLFILPLILYFINLQFNKKNINTRISLNIVCILLSMFLWNVYLYVSWSISNGSVFIVNPDIETFLIIRLVLVLNLVSILIIAIILNKKNKTL